MKNEKIKLNGKTYTINEEVNNVPEVGDVIGFLFSDDYKVTAVEKAASVSEADGHAGIFPEAFNYDFYIVTAVNVEDEDDEVEVVYATERKGD